MLYIATSVSTIIYNALIISWIYFTERNLVIFVPRTFGMLLFAQLVSIRLSKITFSQKIYILQFSFMLSLLRVVSKRSITIKRYFMFKLEFARILHWLCKCNIVETVFFNQSRSQATINLRFRSIFSFYIVLSLFEINARYYIRIT